MICSDLNVLKELFTPGMTVNGRFVVKGKQSMGVIISGGKEKYWGCLPVTLFPSSKPRDRFRMFREAKPGPQEISFQVVGVDLDSKGRPIVILNTRDDFDPLKYRGGKFSAPSAYAITW